MNLLIFVDAGYEWKIKDMFNPEAVENDFDRMTNKIRGDILFVFCDHKIFLNFLIGKVASSFKGKEIMLQISI